VNELQRFADQLEREQESLLLAWRNLVRLLPSAKNLTDPTLNDHIPLLLKELIRSLRLGTDETIPEALASMSGFSHGLQRLVDHYDIEEVVAEYNVLRGCLHDFASDHGIVLQGKPFHVLNRTLDGAIGLAVQTFATQQAEEVKKQREEYLSFIVHDHLPNENPGNSIS